MEQVTNIHRKDVPEFASMIAIGDRESPAALSASAKDDSVDELTKLQRDIPFSAYKTVESKFAIKTSFLQEMESIQNGDYEKEVIAARQIRDAHGKEAYKEYRKKHTYCFTPGVNNSKMGKENPLKEDYTGLGVLDIDKLTDQQKANKQKVKEQLMALPFIVAVGLSIGGDAFFAIFKCDPERAEQSYQSVQIILARLGIAVPLGQQNVNRLRFVSYDPDVYYVQSPALAQNVPIIVTDVTKTPAAATRQNADSKDVFNSIVKIKSKGAAVWQEGDRHAHLISVVTWCNVIGMSEDFCCEMCEEVCRPLMEDGRDYEIEPQVRDIYKRYLGDHNTKPWKEEKSAGPFWEIKKSKPTLCREKFYRLLETEGGFYSYKPDEKTKSTILIQIKGRIVEETNTQEIKKFVVDYINQLPDLDQSLRTDLVEMIYCGADTYFSKAQLEFLTVIKLDFLRHTRDFAYFAFKNGIVVVSKDETKLQPLNLTDKYLWASEINDFEIAVDSSLNVLDCEYCQFIRCISNEEDKRIEYAISLIGYLLHNYKDPTRPYAVILGEETDNEEEGGGTGKGIFIQAISKLTNGVKIDGKNFKTDKSFAFQRVDLASRYIAIEDVRKNLDFESFYSLITEGVTIERKNKDEIFIPYEDSPKIIFTTNYTIPSKGNHGKRRQKVLEFSDFYRPGYTPEDHFKHRLFSDWGNDQWNRFYNFLFDCISVYLDQGVFEVDNSESNKRKQIKVNYSTEFFDWWKQFSDNGTADWKLFSSLYADFLSTNELDKKDFSAKKFKMGMQEASKLFNKKLEKRSCPGYRDASATLLHKNKPEYRVIDVVDP